MSPFTDAEIAALTDAGVDVTGCSGIQTRSVQLHCGCCFDQESVTFIKLASGFIVVVFTPIGCGTPQSLVVPTVAEALDCF